MTLWHRLIGRIVKDGIADGTLAAGTDPYALAALLTGSLEGALMLSRLYEDPAFTDRVVDHLIAYVETLRAPIPRGAVMTALDASITQKPLRATCAAARSRGPIPRGRASAAADLTGYERLDRDAAR